MSLADQIVAVRDQALADLDAAHDYYVHTKAAWRIVQRHVERGGRLSVRNLSTGSVTTEADLPAKAQFYVTEYLAVATFQQFVSVLEVFVMGVWRQWLLAYPRKLEKGQIPVAMVLDAADLDAIKLAVVNRHLNEMAYKRIKDWFTQLGDLVGDGVPTDDEVGRLAEIKATRDVYVHNRGVASATYVEKAGARWRCEVGQRLDLPEHYHRESWELIRKVVRDVAAAAIAKLGGAGVTPR